MHRSSLGITLLELLIAVAVFAVILAVLGAFFVQQTRATALSQAINEAEALGRTVAESVLQDLQIAGSRVAVIGGVPVYASSIGYGCTEAARRTCVVPMTFDGATLDLADSESVIAGFAAFYRTSVDPGGPCRRVDYVLDRASNTLLRSDRNIPCPGTPGDFRLTLSAEELAAARFASDVDAFSIRYACSDGSTAADPGDCYDLEDGFVRQAEVALTIELDRRVSVRREVTMSASTPNLRPGVDYLRDVPDGEGGED